MYQCLVNSLRILCNRSLVDVVDVRIAAPHLPQQDSVWKHLAENAPKLFASRPQLNDLCDALAEHSDSLEGSLPWCVLQLQVSSRITLDCTLTMSDLLSVVPGTTFSPSVRCGVSSCCDRCCVHGVL